MSARRSGVPLWGVVMAALIGGGLLLGVVTLAEALRPPGPTPAPTPSADEEQPVGDEAPVDPRIEVECPEPQPREGDPSDGGALTGSRPVDVGSADLRDCPETYDRSLVSFQGEVVGSVRRRDDGAWARLNDDPYARDLGPLPSHRDYRGANEGVAVLLPHGLADRITTVGGPGRRGDVVEVTGLFHRVDPRSGDMAVIRARSGDLVRPGAEIADAPSPGRARVAILLAALAIGMVAAERLHAYRWRRG